ncbi:hypothetical protein HYQ44_003690 [Verticillium longisporum]|nr:hypothetical protein HYQ44_003690 [Verticillium longisporum]
MKFSTILSAPNCPVANAAVSLDFPENLAFEAMSRDVFEQWQSVGDLWKASHGYVEDFSSRSVRALIYISDKD